jgi:opacity protein-like surface antigen
MKMPAFLKLGTVIAGVAFGLAMQAQNADSKWYFRTDLGASLPMETDLEEFLDLDPAGEAEIEFDAGMRLGVAGGYRITPWLALELESGVLFNSINDTDGDSVDASLTQVPFMGNLVVQCNNFNRWVPFIGVGAGGVSSVLDIDERIDTGAGILLVKGTDADVVFAYQAFAGVRYELNDRMGVGLVYRFMGAQGASWDVENDGAGEDLEIAFDDVFTHSISALFHLYF